MMKDTRNAMKAVSPIQDEDPSTPVNVRKADPKASISDRTAKRSIVANTVGAYEDGGKRSSW
jgi:hypothetical protein